MPFWLLLFKRRIGHDPCCASLEVFNIPDCESLRQKKARRWWCFSMQRTFSSTGGLNPFLASHKSKSWFPFKEVFSLASFSDASPSTPLDATSGTTAVFFSGKLRGSSTVRDRIAQEGIWSSWSRLEHLVSCQDFKVLLHNQTTYFDMFITLFKMNRFYF